MKIKLLLIIYKLNFFLSLSLAIIRSPRSYVALGDSFASGLGYGRVLDERCGRTSYSYGELFNRSHTGIEVYKNAACRQWYINDIQKQQVPEIEALTELVSITAGLYDLDMHHTIAHCDVQYNEDQCAYGVDVAEDMLKTIDADYSPYRRMLDLLRAVRKQTALAVVVIIGYPAFYSPPIAGCVTWDGMKPMREQYKARLNTVVRRLNDLYKNIVRDISPLSISPIIFKNPDDRFGGHRMCDDDFYLKQYPGTVPRDFYDRAWSTYGYYHPIADGQRVYESLLNEAWEETQRPLVRRGT
ncbi:MAG: hypothetical protein Q9160_000025 [Pyrenula sp. 1 TL-2023]